MAASTLGDTDTGAYIDRDGDIVFVFTDEDKKNKSLTLQRDIEQESGRFPYKYGGCHEEDRSPYMPVRLFLPTMKRPDQPAYDFEKIERNEDYDGAWIGDQGTLIVHRTVSDPERTLRRRTLHVMFSYDSHNELNFDLYKLSPIFRRFCKEEKFRSIMADEYLLVVPVPHKNTNTSDYTRETFRDEIDDIQKQIDRMSEKVSSALSLAANATWHAGR